MPIVDMLGKTFGILTVTSRAANDLQGTARWNCHCACGKDVTVIGRNLRNGNTKGCGCLHYAEDITGVRYGRLVAMNQAEYRGTKLMWHFKCDCGQTVTLRKSHVESGSTKSCGCLALELNLQRFTTHGMSYTTEYHIWSSMIARCQNSKHKHYKNYGGRGIKVCERWHEFSGFFSDMGRRPKGLTLDRINNDGNYEPGNCRWATWEQQAGNSRRVKPIRQYASV